MPASRNFSNVNVGTTANDGTGDLLRDSFVKINNNLNSAYSSGQFLAFGTDGRLNPGYTWANDKDTGMYRPGSGKIGFALNGAESLVLNDDGTLNWFGSKLATENYVAAQLASFTGGVSGGNVTVVVDGGGGGGGGGGSNVTVTVNGIPVVSSLPTTGNYEGRFAFYNGDVWIFSCYPSGNGLGKPADPSIGREAGSDCRWTRFRGEGAVTVGTTLPATGVEGQTFYETSSNTLYYWINGQWKTAAAVITPDAPAGLEVLATLPLVSDPNNFEGRTVVVGSAVYIFISGAWQDFNNYLTPTASAGVPAGTVFPSTATAKTGEVFRKEGANAGLYVFDGTGWATISAYTRQVGSTAGIRTLSSLPSAAVTASSYNAGDLLIVGGVVYILNSTKTSWDFFTPGGAGGSITAVTVTAGSIGTQELAANAVTAAKILAGSIISEKIQANAITSREISSDAISARHISSNTITAAKIQVGAIGTAQIAANAITSNLIAAGSITAGKLAVGAINAENIQAANLSVITQNAGRITAGVLQSGDGRMVIDLNNKFIRIEI